MSTGLAPAPRPSKPGVKAWAGSLIALGLVAGGVIAGPRLLAPPVDQAAVVTPPVVAVSVPLQRDVDTRLQFLGQFSTVDQVELRAQVGGTLATKHVAPPAIGALVMPLPPALCAGDGT